MDVDTPPVDSGAGAPKKKNDGKDKKRFEVKKVCVYGSCTCR